MAKRRGLAKIEHIPLEPVTIGCFTLTETGMEVRGVPTFSEYQGIGDWISRAHKCSGWWVADWLAYGETRADYKELLEAVLDVTQYDPETAKNFKNLGENIPPSRRRADVDISKHFVVAPLSPKEQEHWLEVAHDRGLSTRDLRNEIKASRRVKAIKGQAHLAGMYRVIYAHYPWPHSDGRGLSIEAGLKLPVKEHALPDSVLFLWSTAKQLLANPGPRDLIEAWGFTPQTQHIWDMVHGEQNSYAEITHEVLIVATRGSCIPDSPTDIEKSVHVLRRRSSLDEAHPDEFRQMIQKQYTVGPYLELFGRAPREGWSVFGDDPRHWAQQAQPPHVPAEDEVPF
jgi:N6-adenosine-specific RNA methylase IME4